MQIVKLFQCIVLGLGHGYDSETSDILTMVRPLPSLVMPTSTA